MGSALKTPSSVWRNPIHFLAFGFGSGALPKAPGTFGSLAAIIPLMYLQQMSLMNYAILTLLAFIVGIFLCGKTAEDIGVHDHGGIVWDEFVGLWITMFAAPAGWHWVIIGFILFRIFDIAKPAPIGWLDKRVEGGLGIMLDDVLAGVYGLLSLQLLAYFVA